jgi:N-acyl-D-aspartate/D-glutamate deacylase
LIAAIRLRKINRLTLPDTDFVGALRTMKRLLALIFTTTLSLCLASCGGPASEAIRYEVVLAGGRVMDPESGLDSVRNVGIRSGKIVTVSADALDGDRVIDANGLVVAPGFIDLHQHGQSGEAYALSVQDGVTTSFELEVGTDDVEQWYVEREGGRLINYGVSIGHIRVRMAVMGDDGDLVPSGPGGHEVASTEQIAEMGRRIDEGLSLGAVATGFGTAYTPAASTDEIESMFRVSARHGATAHIHVRGPLAGSVEGVLEAISIAKKTGVSLHVVHANSSGGSVTNAFLTIIEAAKASGLDITTEAYPYGASMTRIESALFDGWEAWPDQRFREVQWVESGERLTRETFGKFRETGGEIIIHGRSEALTLAAVANPLTMIASDGYIINGRGHPRSSGTFAKVLGKYVREDNVLALMDALRKMTIEPARRLQMRVPAMRNKGRIFEGADADMTVFDPATVIDRSTYTNAALPSQGIKYVLVNGVVVVDDGELVPHTRPGKPVRAEIG